MDSDADHDHVSTGAPVVLPILPVRALDEAEALHTALGLDVERYDDGYAWVRFGQHDLWHLRVVPDLDPLRNPTSIYLFVGELEAARRTLVELGLDPTPIEVTPWRMREMSVRDPSGNLIRMGCPHDSSTERDDMGR